MRSRWDATPDDQRPRRTDGPRRGPVDDRTIRVERVSGPHRRLDGDNPARSGGTALRAREADAHLAGGHHTSGGTRLGGTSPRPPGAHRMSSGHRPLDSNREPLTPPRIRDDHRGTGARRPAGDLRGQGAMPGPGGVRPTSAHRRAENHRRADGRLDTSGDALWVEPDGRGPAGMPRRPGAAGDAAGPRRPGGYRPSERSGEGWRDGYRHSQGYRRPSSYLLSDPRDGDDHDSEPEPRGGGARHRGREDSVPPAPGGHDSGGDLLPVPARGRAVRGPLAGRRRMATAAATAAIVVAGFAGTVAVHRGGAGTGTRALGVATPVAAASSAPASAAARNPAGRTVAPASATMPNVVGRSLTDAENHLAAAGIAIDTVDATGQGRAVDDHPGWTVVRQSVQAGRRTGPGTKVTLYVLKTGEQDAGALS